MPSENKDRSSIPLALELPPNPRSTASNTPTPLGTLSTLPRELRDEIYGHLHEQTYHISLYPQKTDFKWRSVRNNTDELPMITLSKAIHQEYLAVLFGKAVFVLGNVDRKGGAMWESGEIPFIDQIQNVRYTASPGLPGHIPTHEVSRIFRDRRLVKQLMSKTSPKPIEFFTGTAVLRDTCSIELHPILQKVMPVLQSPLIMAIGGLTGFKIVTLKLTSGTWKWSRSLALSGRELSDAEHAENFRGAANAFRNALEPSLGPSLGPIIISKDYDNRLALELTFRPRDYVASRNKVTAIPSELGGEGSESLSQVGDS